VIKINVERMQQILLSVRVRSINGQLVEVDLYIANPGQLCIPLRPRHSSDDWAINVVAVALFPLAFDCGVTWFILFLFPPCAL
jgi:hypothetical protein